MRAAAAEEAASSSPEPGPAHPETRRIASSTRQTAPSARQATRTSADRGLKPVVVVEPAVRGVTTSVGAAAAGTVRPQPPGSPRGFGFAQDGRTVDLKVGQTMTLDIPGLHDSAPGVLAPVGPSPGGTGMVYRAVAPGNATLTASIGPACRRARPACMIATRAFLLTVVVSVAS